MFTAVLHTHSWKILTHMFPKPPHYYFHWDHWWLYCQKWDNMCFFSFHFSLIYNLFKDLWPWMQTCFYNNFEIFFLWSKLYVFLWLLPFSSLLTVSLSPLFICWPLGYHLHSLSFITCYHKSIIYICFSTFYLLFAFFNLFV